MTRNVWHMKTAVPVAHFFFCSRVCLWFPIKNHYKLRNLANPLEKWDKDKYDIHDTEGIWRQVANLIEYFKLLSYRAGRVVKTCLWEETIRKTNCMHFVCSPLYIFLGFRWRYRSWHRCLSPTKSTNHGTFLADKANSMASSYLNEAGALHLPRYFYLLHYLFTYFQLFLSVWTFMENRLRVKHFGIYSSMLTDDFEFVLLLTHVSH